MAISSLWFYNSGASMLNNRLWLLALVLIICVLSVRPVHADGNVTIITSYTYSSTVYYTTYDVRLRACSDYYGGTTNCLPPNNFVDLFSTSVAGETLQIFRLGNFYGSATISSSCPSNSTLSGGQCVCNTNYVPNTGATACQAVSCPANGTTFNSGFYDVGIDPNINNGFPSPLIACNSNCQVAYNGGNISQRALVGGVYHYYSSGGYFHTGQICLSGSGSPSSISSIPANTCGSGQTLVTGSNGYAKCYTISTGLAVDGNSASAVQSATTLANASASSAIQSATTLALSSGLDASAVQQAGAVAAGVTASGGTGGSQQAKEPVLDEFCKNNPSAQICADKDFGTVENTNLGEKNISVAITPVTVGSAGVCPAPTAITIHGQTKYMEWTTYCNYAIGVKPILLAFAWLSAATMLIAGFRTA